MLVEDDSRIGYVYKISGYGLNYFGSTIQGIQQRKNEHINTQLAKKNTCASALILEKGDEWKMEIIEILTTDKTKKNLFDREQYWIDTNECVNKFKAIRTPEYRKEYQRIWAEKNRKAKGIQPKPPPQSEEEIHRKAREYMRLKRASYTQEERALELNKKTERYDNEKQKEYVNRPDVKAKRMEQQQRKREIVKLFKVLPFADI